MVFQAFFYGDPDGVRALSRRFAGQADQMRDAASAVLRVVDATPWCGEAATVMASAVRGRAADLLHTADLYDDAARELADHARTVAERLALIEATERLVLEAVSAARTRVADVAAGLLDRLDPRDELLAAFQPPPSGSSAWLTLRLPVPIPGLP